MNFTNQNNKMNYFYRSLFAVTSGLMTKYKDTSSDVYMGGQKSTKFTLEDQEAKFSS